MKKKILFVVLVLSAICTSKNEKGDNNQSNHSMVKGITLASDFNFRAGITPPILPPPRPQKMYEEPVSSVTESYQLT